MESTDGEQCPSGEGIGRSGDYWAQWVPQSLDASDRRRVGHRTANSVRPVVLRIPGEQEGRALDSSDCVTGGHRTVRCGRSPDGPVTPGKPSGALCARLLFGQRLVF